MPSSRAPSRKSTSGGPPRLILVEESSDDGSSTIDSGSTRAPSSRVYDDDSSFPSIVRDDGCDSFEDGVSMVWNLLSRVFGCHGTSDMEEVEQLVTLRQQDWHHPASCDTMSMSSPPKHKSKNISSRQRKKKSRSTTTSRNSDNHSMLEDDAVPTPPQRKPPSSPPVQKAAKRELKQGVMNPSSPEHSLSSSLMIKSRLSAPPSIQRVSPPTPLEKSDSLEFLFGPPTPSLQKSDSLEFFFALNKKE